MKKTGRRMLVVMALLGLVFLSSCSAEKKETVPVVTVKEETVFRAENAQGSSVDAFFNETDGVWYLAVPSSWDLSEVKIYYPGQVTETEKGELDQTTSSISGAFESSLIQNTPIAMHIIAIKKVIPIDIANFSILYC
jgi:hypothetical protein